MRGTDTHGARRARPHLDLAARRVGGDVEDGVAVVVPAKGHVHNVNVFSLFALILLPGGADDPQHQHREHHRLPCRGVGARTKHAVTVFGVTNVARRTKLPRSASTCSGGAGGQGGAWASFGGGDSGAPASLSVHALALSSPRSLHVSLPRAGRRALTREL